MRYSVPILAAALGLVCAPFVLAQSSGSTSSGGIIGQSRLPLGTTPADIQADGISFVMTMAIGDLFEIESSNLALDRSRNNEIKSFARMMAQDHAQSAEKLKDAYKKSGIADPLPTRLDQAHAQKMARLRSLTGPDFDHAYMLAHLEGHQQAVTLLQTYSLKGDKPALKMFATEALPTVQKHLGQAQRLATPMSAAN